MRGAQRWRDVRIWGDAGPLWFHASRAEHPCVSRHAGDLSCVFPSLFCRPSSSLRPIQSLTSGKGRSSRPVDRGALILRVACRKSCRNLERGERFNMATPDEIRENELGNKAKILGCCLRRSPSTDVWAADYGCLLVYETPDCSGEFRRFENLDQVEEFLVKREQSGT